MAILVQNVQAVRTARGDVMTIGTTSTSITVNSQFVRVSGQQFFVAYRWASTSATAAAAATTDSLIAAGAIEYLRCATLYNILHIIAATGGALAAGFSVSEVID